MVAAGGPDVTRPDLDVRLNPGGFPVDSYNGCATKTEQRSDAKLWYPRRAMIGRTISHYRITGKLGVGGMGIVYEGEDVRLARPVALKFLPQELADDPEAARRLQREAQTIGGLNHPNICTIYEIDEHEGVSFIAMERVQGVNLKLHIARGPLSTDEVLDIALQVTQALGAAHTEGIVHRDIKPGNILISGAGIVKVLDFGLARRFMEPQTGELVVGGSTILGRPVGTVSYMAPERILQLPLDGRSDLFSLGVVIYEMATGRPPFAGASPSETVTNILEKDPTPLTRLSPERPPQLERIVNLLLAKAPENRYQSAEALRAALAAVRYPPSLWQRLFRKGK
jgi:eukaryotic-like serine/threonine-protein kinase